MNGAFECPCESCKELFNCSTLWEQHQLWHHDSSQKYQCVKCGLLFARAIKNHVRVRKKCVLILIGILRLAIKHAKHYIKEQSNTTSVICNSVVLFSKEYLSISFISHTFFQQCKLESNGFSCDKCEVNFKTLQLRRNHCCKNSAKPIVVSFKHQ